MKPMLTEFGGQPVAGGTYPALIWHNFMMHAMRSRPRTNRQEGRDRRDRPIRRPLAKAGPYEGDAGGHRRRRRRHRRKRQGQSHAQQAKDSGETTCRKSGTGSDSGTDAGGGGGNNTGGAEGGAVAPN